MNFNAKHKHPNGFGTLMFIAALLLITILMSRGSLAQTGASDFVLVTLDRMPVRVTAAVKRDGDKFILEGAVTRHCPPKIVLWGHIDVIVMDKSDKEILNLPIAYRPNPVIQRPSAVSHFKWTIPPSVTPGARIELRYAGGAHDSH